jgi:hypothetical protein
MQTEAYHLQSIYGLPVKGSEQLPPFFLSSSAVTNTVTCKSRKIHKTVGFNFFFPFLDLFSTFFPFFQICLTTDLFLGFALFSPASGSWDCRSRCVESCSGVGSGGGRSGLMREDLL